MRKIVNKNVNINLYEGEILSILGENGSGKTTLMNVLSGIYTPDEGEIYINNRLAHIHSPLNSRGSLPSVRPDQKPSSYPLGTPSRGVPSYARD